MARKPHGSPDVPGTRARDRRRDADAPLRQSGQFVDAWQRIHRDTSGNQIAVFAGMAMDMTSIGTGTIRRVPM